MTLHFPPSLFLPLPLFNGHPFFCPPLHSSPLPSLLCSLLQILSGFVLMALWRRCAIDFKCLYVVTISMWIRVSAVYCSFLSLSLERGAKIGAILLSIPASFSARHRPLLSSHPPTAPNRPRGTVVARRISIGEISLCPFEVAAMDWRRSMLILRVLMLFRQI